MDTEVAHSLAKLAWRYLGGSADRFCGGRIVEQLAPVIDTAVVEQWLTRVDDASLREPGDRAINSIQDRFDGPTRRGRGIFLTPPRLAEAMAAAVGQVGGADAGDGEVDAGDTRSGGVVVDLSAGAASLLVAVIRRRPELRVVGIERNPALAIAAAINVVATRGRQPSNGRPDQIIVGDGLAEDRRWSELKGSAWAVLGNPPYVREKGRREVFAELRDEHDHLEEFFGPRMDLQYLFLHRSASFVRPGGRLIMLTSAYWTSATHAEKVRAALTDEMTPRCLVRLEAAGTFADAPGHHSLISVFSRPEREADKDQAHNGDDIRALSLDQEPDDWADLMGGLVDGACKCDAVYHRRPDAFGAAPWSPFVGSTTVQWARRLEREGTALNTLLADRQGFVSGADRFSARHPKWYDGRADLPQSGEPIFLFDGDEIPPALAGLDPTVIRPVLRGSRLHPNDVIVTPPDEEFALYVDGPVDERAEAVLANHLQRFRPILERRREVRNGRMPWYRLHWPRTRAEQTGPKLVAPRRAPSPCFGLDLSASAISSDCTYLIAPDDVPDPLAYLVRLMVVLNSDPVERYLRHFGKSKGTQLEFYSQPLRSLPLPLRVRHGRLQWIDGLVDDSQRARCDQRAAAVLPTDRSRG